VGKVAADRFRPYSKLTTSAADSPQVKSTLGGDTQFDGIVEWGEDERLMISYQIRPSLDQQ
jgi:hypothetical protein